MKHNVTLGIVAIVAAMTLTAMAFAIPQQALAYRHHNNHNSNSLKVDQQINQLNNCTTAICDNQANNNFGPPPVVVVWH
jgi:conjugal transfer/entry exclusion protein